MVLTRTDAQIVRPYSRYSSDGSDALRKARPHTLEENILFLRRDFGISSEEWENSSEL